MAVYSRSEFCAISGVTTRQISIYVSRKNLYLDENDRINCDIEPNKTFLQKRLSKGKAKSLPEKDIEVQIPVKKIRQKEEGNYATLTESMQLDMEQKRYAVQKTRLEVELKEIDKQKKLGALIPIDLVKPIMSTLTHSITNEFKNYMEEFLREAAKIYSIPSTSVAESKGILVKGLNNAVDKAVNASLKKVKVIVSEFSETRRVGEHD